MLVSNYAFLLLFWMLMFIIFIVIVNLICHIDVVFAFYFDLNVGDWNNPYKKVA